MAEADEEDAAASEDPSEGASLEPVQQQAAKPARADGAKEKIRTLDRTERRFGIAAIVLLALMALLLVPHLFHNTTTFESEPLVKGHCNYPRYPGEPSGCHLKVITHPSDYVAPLIALVVFAGAALLGLLRNRRSLLAFTSLLGGLAVFTLVYPPVGLLLILYGGWLMARAWRLQRYGVADAKSVRKIVAERSAQRSVERKAARQARRTGVEVETSAGRTKVAPSKRYTPKAKSRRRT